MLCLLSSTRSEKKVRRVDSAIETEALLQGTVWGRVVIILDALGLMVGAARVALVEAEAQAALRVAI